MNMPFQQIGYGCMFGFFFSWIPAVKYYYE